MFPVDTDKMIPLLTVALSLVDKEEYPEEGTNSGVIQGRFLDDANEPEFRAGTHIDNFKWRREAYPHCVSFSFRKWVDRKGRKNTGSPFTTLGKKKERSRTSFSTTFNSKREPSFIGTLWTVLMAEATLTQSKDNHD